MRASLAMFKLFQRIIFACLTKDFLTFVYCNGQLYSVLQCLRFFFIFSMNSVFILPSLKLATQG